MTAPRHAPDVLALYLGTIVAHVRKNLRYPGAAKARHEQGTSVIQLTLDPGDRVVALALTAARARARSTRRRCRSSSEPSRFQMPREMAAHVRDFTLPMRFKLR